MRGEKDINTFQNAKMAMRPKKRLHLKMLHSEVQLTELTSGMGQIRLIG